MYQSVICALLTFLWPLWGPEYTDARGGADHWCTKDTLLALRSPFFGLSAAVETKKQGHAN